MLEYRKIGHRDGAGVFNTGLNILTPFEEEYIINFDISTIYLSL
jgi:hypothetical protein